MAEEMFSFPLAIRGTWAEAGKARKSRAIRTMLICGLDLTSFASSPIGI
jgi:hypothetical protein